MKPITVGMKGGLGNQLFTYFAALNLAHQLNASMNLHFLNYRLENRRDNSILNFRLSPKVNKIKVGRTIIGEKYKLLNYLKGKSQNKEWNNFFSRNMYLSSEIGYDPNLESLSKVSYIEGYFQTWRYIDRLEIFEKQIKLLKKREESYEILKLAEKKKPIIMHARRGDYIANKDQFGILSEKYFKNALNIVNQVNKEHEIWIFSEDYDYGRYLEKILGARSHYFEQNYKLFDFEILEIMRQGSAHIISNSSFSYMAALLSENTKKVVCPAKWFKGREDPLDLIPDKWIKIKSEWI